MVASYGTWRYSIRAYKWLRAMSVMFPICQAPRPHSSISEEFLHSTILLPKKLLGSWNLVFSVWMKCGRMNVLPDDNPWQINTKPLQHQTFAIEKFQDSIITTRLCPRDKNISFKKNIQKWSVYCKYVLNMGQTNKEF